MTPCRLVLAIILLTVLFGPVRPADADTIIVLQRGSSTIPSTSARPRVTMGGPGLEFEALFEHGAFDAELCRPCLPGSTLKLSGFTSGVGTGRFYVAGDFTFTAESALVPSDGSAEVTLTAPFTFAGQIAPGLTRNPHFEDPPNRVELAGKGVATVRLSSAVDAASGQRLYFFQSLTYQFTGGAE